MNDNSLLIGYNADGMYDGCDIIDISNPCNTLNKDHYCYNNTIYNCGPCSVQFNINYTVHNIKGLVNKGIRFQNYDESTQKRVCQSGVFKLDVKTKSEYG